MKPLDILLAILISAVWGFNFIAAKFTVMDFTPLMANTVRFSLVMVLLMPFLRVVSGSMKIMLSIAFLLGVAHFGLIFLAVSLANGVGAVAVSTQLSVPFSTILAVIFLKETVGWKRVVGIALSFAGVMYLGFDPVVFNYLDALFVGALASLVYAVCAILMRKLQNVSPMTIQSWVAVAGFTGSACLTFLFEDGQVAMVKNATLNSWLAILYTVIGSSVIGHIGANYLFKKYDVSAVSPYFLLMTVFAIIGGVVVFDEEISYEVIIGASLTIIGVLVVTLRNRTRRSKVAGLETIEG